MKNFFKITFASLLAFIIGSILLLFIGMGIIGAIVASGDKPVTVKNNSVLEITLNKEIMDRGSDNPMDGFDFMKMKPRPKLGLNNINIVYIPVKITNIFFSRSVILIAFLHNLKTIF